MRTNWSRVKNVVVSLFLCATIVFLAAFTIGCGGKGGSDAVVIKIGTHSRADDDPTYKDPVTGEYVMEPEIREAYEKAAKEVLKQHNVKIEWVEYQENAITDVLRSLLANDPICDIALCVTDSQGTLMGQNVFQELDAYAHLFEDEEYSWMWIDPIFGHNYLLQHDVRLTTSPLAFNISMLDEVDALKDSNGNTVYPTDLYKKGEWTWSTFRDYLTKVDAHFANKKSAITNAKIYASEMTSQVAVRQAIHSNGGAIYSSENGLEVGSAADLGAMEYLQDLYDRGLMRIRTRSSTNPISIGQPVVAQSFVDGESVFASLYTWGTGWIGGELADRGESMGLVPFPIADGADASDPKYDQISIVSDTCSIVRGLSEEKTELAIKAFRTYYHTYWCERGGVDTMVNYSAATAEKQALADGYDVYNEKIGKDIIDIYASMYNPPVNDLSTAVSIHNQFTFDVATASITGIAKGYSVHIKEQLPVLNTTLNTIKSALSSGKLVDIVPPIISARAIPVPKGSGEAQVKEQLSKFVTIKDTMEGEIDTSSAVLELGNVDFNKVGDYTGVIKAYDSSLNEANATIHIYIYDADNKTPPTVKVKSVYRIIKLDEDVSTIKWSDFIETAKDANGLNLMERIKGDTTTLNTSMEGTYDVKITVTDYAGNETTVTVPLVVVG